MQFHLDADDGDCIRGWIIPDNPMQPADIIIQVDGEVLAESKADSPRLDIKNAGMHPTGNVGFVIDTASIPALNTCQNLSLYESESNVLIYRRFNISKHLEHKLAFFYQPVLPNTKLIHEISGHFSMSHNYVERYSLETMLHIIRTCYSKSILVMGRLNLNRYMTWMRDEGFKIVALLKDPFEDLAERLIFLNFLNQTKHSKFLPTFGAGMMPLSRMAQTLDFSDERQMKDIFRRASDQEKLVLRNPLTRMLGCDVDETAERRHVPIALDNLAAMDLVGVCSMYEEFQNSLADLVGSDILQNTSITQSADVTKLASSLSRIQIVVDFLEHDLALYTFITDALNSALNSADHA